MEKKVKEEKIVLTKAEKVNAVAIVEPTSLEMMEIVEKELLALSNETGDKFKTGNATFQSIKIKDCTDVRSLVKLAGFVIDAQKQYITGQQALGLTSVPEFKMSDCTLEDILMDIKLAINIVTHKDRKAELEDLIKVFGDLVTKDEKRKSAMKKAASLGFDLNNM